MSDRDNAKRIILGILHEAGGRFVGASRLNKAFWLAHLWHWKNHPGTLTQHPIVKANDGPAIDDRKGILRELVDDGRVEQKRYKDRGEMYVLLGPPPVLSDTEIDSVSRALKTLGGLGYDELSKESHLASWHQAVLGEEQAIGLDIAVLSDGGLVDRALQHHTKAREDLRCVFE